MTAIRSMSCLPTEPRPIPEPSHDGPVAANPKKQFPVKPIHTPRTMKSRTQMQTIKSRAQMKTALVLASIACTTFAGIIAKYWMLNG